MYISPALHVIYVSNIFIYLHKNWLVIFNIKIKRPKFTRECCDCYLSLCIFSDTRIFLSFYIKFKQISTTNSGPGSLLMQVLHKKGYREKYEIPPGWVRLEPTLASTVHSPSESGDITTAPLRLLKNKFHGIVLCLISLNDRRIEYILGALTHSLYTRNSLDYKDTEAWKNYYNIRSKQTSTKNPTQDH